MGVISWLQKRPVEEVRMWLKRAGDIGEFPLSNRLSIRYAPTYLFLPVVFKWRRKHSNGNRIEKCMWHRNCIIGLYFISLLRLCHNYITPPSHWHGHVLR